MGIINYVSNNFLHCIGDGIIIIVCTWIVSLLSAMITIVGIKINSNLIKFIFAILTWLSGLATKIEYGVFIAIIIIKLVAIA